MADMARNRSQFQKGYSRVQFMDEYGSEEKCIEALFRWRWPNGFVRPRCSHSGHCRVQSCGLYQCSGCRYQVSLTAGTILGNIKRSFHGTYHHLSSKHLPRYLAEFSYRFSRRFLLREVFPRLAFVAVRTPPMPYRVLKLAENYA